MSDTPGLRQAFEEWYSRTSRKYKEPVKYRDRAFVEQTYLGFVSGTNWVGFQDHRIAGLHFGMLSTKIPPHLIAIRDMSLI